MNILLIRPPDPFQHVSLLSHTRPMNLAYLASYLRSKGFTARIIDFETEPFTADRYRQLLHTERPALIGVSCVTPTIRNGAMLCQQAKEFDPSIVTVVGGPHVNALPVETLREFPAIDCTIYGEGELTLAELAAHIREWESDFPIAGLAYRRHEEIILNPARPLISDIDSLPFPARDLIDYGSQPGHSTRGFSNRLLSTELFTSRGCPFGCTFCAIQTTFGKTVRFRDITSIREEVRQIVDDHAFNHIVIADDTFSLRQDRAFEIADILGGSGIASWNCDTRVTSVSRELLLAMRKSGCQKVAFGVESGSPRILDSIGKKISIEQVRDAVHWAKEAGIRHIEGNFIIGSDPSETHEDVAMTRKLITTLPWTFVSISIIVPYPGTPVHQAMRKLELMPDDVAWEDYVMFGAVPKWRTTNFTPRELLELQKKLSRQFYLNPRYIVRQLASVRSWTDIQYWVSAGAAYARWYLTGRL